MNGLELSSMTLDRLKEAHGLKMILAVSGGADSKLPQLAHDPSEEYQKLQDDHRRIRKEQIKRIIEELLNKFSGLESKIGILTGGTKGDGVPELATIMAKEKGFKTIGIFPETGCKHYLGDEYIDIPLCIKSIYQDCKQNFQLETTSSWGDESSVFAKALDAVVVIGGSAGTLIEIAYVLKMNDRILKEQKKSGSTCPKLKYIVPISGFGGVSENIYHIWADPEVTERSILSFTVNNGEKRPGRIYNGVQAANALLFTKQLAIGELYD